jgi:transcriptional regulator with XRE-family HTH domain
VAALSPAHRALGEEIRRLRTDRGLSQEALGEAAAMHRNYIGMLERGERNPSLTNLLRLAAALQTSAADLVAVAEAAGPPPRRRLRVV